MILIDFEHFSCRASKNHCEQGPASEMFERVLIDLIFGEYRRVYRKIVRTGRLNFKKQAFNVKFHAGPKFRADRHSRLHKRAAARAHHGSRAGRLRRPNHGCSCSSCRECPRLWRQGLIVVAKCRMRRLQHHGGRSHSAEVRVYTGARLGPCVNPSRAAHKGSGSI
jgi:hypothetical protein